MEIHPHDYSGLCGISFIASQYLFITSITLFDMSAVTVVLISLCFHRLCCRHSYCYCYSFLFPLQMI